MGPVSVTAPRHPDVTIPPEREEPRRRGGPPDRAPLYFGIVVFIALCFLLGSDVFQGNLADTDVYSYANRVVDLRTDGDWFDDTVDRISPPEGHKQHWSRPFDSLMLLGAVALEPLVGFEDGLVAWASVLPVLLGVASITIAWWGFAGRLGRPGRSALPILFATSFPILGTFVAGRADHQALIALLLVALLAQSSHMLTSDAVSRRAAISVGATAGAAMWVGVESSLIVGFTFAALSIAWAVDETISLSRLREASAAWTVSSAIALVLENGTGWNRQDLDELSLVFVFLAASITLGLFLISGLDRGRYLRAQSHRIGALGVLFVVTAAVMLTLFPEVRNGPGGNIDPLYRETRLLTISEAQGVATVGLRHSLSRLVLVSALAPFAVVGALSLVRAKGRRRVPWQPFLPPVIAAALFGLYSYVGVKFAGPAALAMLPLGALAFDRLPARLPDRRVLGIVALAGLWWLPLVIALGLPETTTIQSECSVTEAAEELGDPSGLGARPGLVMSNADAGPEVLFRSPHSVMSIPNHRFQAGYTATINTMMAPDAETARVAFEASGADYLLVCSDFAAEWASTEPNFFDHLTSEPAPDWLRELPLSRDAGGMRLFEATGA